MRMVDAHELTGGDVFVWTKRPFAATEVEIDARSGRVSIKSGSRGTVFFGKGEKVELIEVGDVFWCNSCARSTTLTGEGCSECGNFKVKTEPPLGNMASAGGTSRLKLADDGTGGERPPGKTAPSTPQLDLYPSSGSWRLDLNNAAQMARIFVDSVDLLASHPIRGMNCISNHDLAAAEYWFNETADCATAALCVPSVFRDERVNKTIKHMKNPAENDTWGTVLRMGSADISLRNLYLDAAKRHSYLVLENSSRFPLNDRLEDSVARHLRDTLFDMVGQHPASDEEFIRSIRSLRYATMDPITFMTFGELRPLLYAIGFPTGEAKSIIEKVGSKRVTKSEWRTLQLTAYYNTAARLEILARRQRRDAVLSELRVPGSGEYACSSPDPNPRPPIGWFPDPARQAQFRYFNGLAWTNDVSSYGTPRQDTYNVSLLNQ